MRRTGRLFVLAALSMTVWPASILGQSDEPGVHTSQGDLGGRFVVEVPSGAAPPGTTISVTSRDPSQRPGELVGQPMRSPFYELQPLDVRFSVPVTVTRLIELQELDIDEFEPGRDGLAVGSLFTRDADGTWSWLEDADVRLDVGDAAFTLTGSTDHGGPILAYVAGDLIVATEDAIVTPVGQAFRVEGQLRVDPASRADIADVSGQPSDETIAMPMRSYKVESFDRAAGLEFQCLAPGTVQYETTFTVTDVADVSPLNDSIGLTGTDVAVTHMGEHTCG